MVEQLTADTPVPAPIKPGYKTSEFWLTLASVLVGSSFLFGVIGSETKDSLTSALQHGVESIFLVGGQFFVLCRYIKSRKEAKIAEEVQKQKEEHDKLVAEIRAQQDTILAAQLEAIKADYERQLEALRKKPTPRTRKKKNG